MADYDRVMGKLDYLEETKIQIKEAIRDKGQDILDSDTFRTYVEKIQQITDGGVKIFNSIEEMQQDPKAKEGDLAVVYNTLFTDIYFGVSFSAMLIPKIINISTTSETGRTLIANSTGEDYGNFSCYIPAFETGSEQTLNIVLQNPRKRIDPFCGPLRHRNQQDYFVQKRYPERPGRFIRQDLRRAGPKRDGPPQARDPLQVELFPGLHRRPENLRPCSFRKRNSGTLQRTRAEKQYRNRKPRRT